MYLLIKVRKGKVYIVAITYKSKMIKEPAQINELLIKVICHNICVVIQEVNELGVKAEFGLEQTREVSV